MHARRYRRAIATVVVVALAVAGAQAAEPGQSWAQGGGGKGAAPAPVSNAFAMGGGIGGQIDQRTGAFQATVPLLNVSGRGGSDLTMSLSYDQNLAGQGAAGNRFGFGAGWALGLPWVNTVGTVQVYAASGGSFAYDAGSPTGLREYPLQDLTFAKASGTLTARSGLAQARGYTYTLKQYDGTTDYFDANGNLLEQSDRFGNRIDLTWKQSGSAWQPTAAIDNYGDVTTFDYSTPGQVKVTAPMNAENIAASTTLNVQGGVLRTVTDASGAVTAFGYASVGGSTSQLLHTVTSPNGAKTTVNYAALAFESSVVVVANVQVADGSGNSVQTQRTFSADPPGNVAHHNYTGYPTYQKSGTDGLFDSNDKGYRYSTTLSDGRSSVTETYNSLHLLVTRAIRVTDPVRGSVLQQTQTYTYPAVTTVQSLPANYAKPTGVTVVYGDPVYGATRTTTSSSTYDNRGELESSTDETGTTTTTTYDPTFGVPLTETTTGADGTTTVTTNTLSTDASTVKTSSTAVGSAGQKPTARTVTTYAYDGSGEVTGQLQAWAPGAEPSGPGAGPDQLDTTRTITTDTAARTRTVVDTQAAGTKDAAATTTVTDLITGNVLSTTDPDQLTTSYTYDALGRVRTETAPGNRITTTSYPSPLVTDVTDPTGHISQTTSDVLGRTVKVTDNVTDIASGETLGSDPTARTLTVDSYSVDGSTSTSTPTTGATTTTSYDPLQRPVKVVNPDGLTQSIAYNDVANTKTTSIVPIGAHTASAVTVESFDDLARTLGSATTYPDNTPQTPSTQSYDGLGRVSAATSDDVTATPSYTGAGGEQNDVTLTPTDTATFPGGTEVASTDNTMTGALSGKTLTDNASTGPTSTSGATFTYDAAGRVATATDPGGGTTSYTYTLGGKAKTVTAPTGTVTTYTYSPTTGQLLEKDLAGTDGTTQKTAYTYYAASGLVETIYDPDHPSNVIKYEYDPDGHTTGVQYPDGTTSAASYALNGELASTTDLTGATTTYRYSSAGILAGATQTRAGAQIATVSYGYDSLDRVHTIDRGNGVITTITYSDGSEITDQVTTGPNATTLRDDAYTYDAHGNTSSHTTTTGATSTTTRYGYDAYNRLISSAVYPNATGLGTPSSSTAYVLDAGGDVTHVTTTANGTTTTTVNTITAGDRLTTQTVNGSATSQTYTADGSVSDDLDGDSYQYNLADQPTSVTTPGGTTTSYTYWPDGTRRSADTTVNGVTHSTTLHYDTTGRADTDTYADTTAGSSPQTASYLFGINRESRSLADGSSLGSAPPPPACSTQHGKAKCPHPAPPCPKDKDKDKSNKDKDKNKDSRGKPGVAATPAPTSTDAPGTQYYLADAHGSMVSVTNSAGAVAATYQYGDYGQTVGTNPAALTAPAATTAANAAVNPFTYNGAYTDPATGTQVLPARNYDPTQGRFLSLDSSDMLNRYQAFDTNPIDNTDPSGHIAVPQIVSDAVTAVLFLVFAVLSVIPVVGAVFGAATFAEMSAATVATFVGNVATVATNVGALATSATLTADDAYVAAGKNGFLDGAQREDLETSTFALGTAAGVAGGVAGGAGIQAGNEVAAELETTGADLSQAQTTLATTQTNLTTAETSLTRTQADLLATQTTLTTTEDELATTRTDLTDTQAQLTDTQTQLTDTQTQLTDTQAQLTNTQDELNATLGQRDNALDQLTTAQSKLATTTDELTSTRNELKETAVQVATLTAKLAATTESGSQAMQQSDPNAHPNPVPIAANQGSDSPISFARGRNLPLSRGWTPFQAPF